MTAPGLRKDDLADRSKRAFQAAILGEFRRGVGVGVDLDLASEEIADHDALARQ